MNTFTRYDYSKLENRIHDIEVRLAVIDKCIAGIDELNDQKFESLEEAKRLQADEYARRLEILNGEAERLRTMQLTYINKDVYEANYSSLVSKIDANTKFMYMALGVIFAVEFAIRYFG